MTVLPAKMKAIEIRDFGPPEGLQLTKRTMPVPNKDEVPVSYTHLTLPTNREV